MTRIFRVTIIIVIFSIGFLSAHVVARILAHGGDTSLIHGCIRPLSGLLRIIGANDDCHPGETPLDWRGTTNTNFRDGELTEIATDPIVAVESNALCLPDEEITGGGYTMFDSSGTEYSGSAQDYKIVSSRPAGNLGENTDQQGWIVTAISIGEGGFFKAHAVCAAP